MVETIILIIAAFITSIISAIIGMGGGVALLGIMAIVIPEGYYLVLTVRGKDYEYPLAQTQSLSNFKNQLTGCGPFLHNDPFDRNKNLESTTTLHFSPENPSYLLLPIIPEK